MMSRDLYDHFKAKAKEMRDMAQKETGWRRDAYLRKADLWEREIAHGLRYSGNLNPSIDLSPKCGECGAAMECLSGRSAHISNWYCPTCTPA